MEKDIERESVLRQVDKVSRSMKGRCPASRIPLMLNAAVQSLVSEGVLATEQDAGRWYLRRVKDA